MIVPRLEVLFKAQNQEGKLPALTRYVINTCHFISNHWIAIVLMTIIAIFAIKSLSRRYRLRVIDILNIPPLKHLRNETELYKFFTTAAMLAKFGLPLQESLSMSRTLLVNTKLKQIWKVFLERMSQGERFFDCIKSSNTIKPTVKGLILAGEQSGQLTNSFSKIAEIYKDSVESTLKIITTLIEPVLIILLAIVVGTVVIAMFLPMVTLAQNVQI